MFPHFSQLESLTGHVWRPPDLRQGHFLLHLHLWKPVSTASLSHLNSHPWTPLLTFDL